MSGRIPRKGECYRHFKGNRYQVLAVARHTETGEELVVYEGLYGEHPVYARPLEMFTGKIDRNRFPGVTQEYRFELEEDTAVPDEGASNLILEFLDLETCGEKRSFLQRHRTELTDTFLDIAAQSLDFSESGKTLEARYQDLLRYLETRERYESGRLH